MRPNTLYLEASIAVIIAIATLAVGVLVAWLIARSIERRKQEKLELEAKDLISQAQEQASQSLLEAKDEALKITRQAEIELAHRRSELNKEDDRLVKRREELDHRFDQMQQREAALITFLVTASGMSFLGLSAAFWGLIFGLFAHLLLNLRRVTPQVRRSGVQAD